MAIAEFKDSFILFKESIKSKIADNLFSRNCNPTMPLVRKITKRLGIKRIEKIINGKPKSYVIVADNMVIRIPLDKQTTARYRLNKIMLKKLAQTEIADFVPRFIEEGKVENYNYYCEEKLSGSALDVPLSKMDGMVKSAADFITNFHRETAQKITLNEKNFKRLFSRSINKLSGYLEKEYKEKLAKIEDNLKKQLLGITFVTVWQHGDYKIENILFNTFNWEIKGIIDWDLSEKEGLPLLDIFYLLLYKDSLETQDAISYIFKNRFLVLNLLNSENKIITNYLGTLKIPKYCLKSMLIMFWFQHITKRYHDRLINKNAFQEEWFRENIYNVINVILLH